jgi:hypothetical protein
MDENGLSKYVDQPIEARGSDRDVVPSPATGPIVQPSMIAASN